MIPAGEHPAADHDASARTSDRLTETERERLHRAMRNWRGTEEGLRREVLFHVERIVAERVRVVEAERDGWRDRAAINRDGWRQMLARAESAEAAHAALRARVEALDRSGRMSFDHADLRALLAGGGA